MYSEGLERLRRVGVRRSQGDRQSDYAMRKARVRRDAIAFSTQGDVLGRRAVRLRRSLLEEVRRQRSLLARRRRHLLLYRRGAAVLEQLVGHAGADHLRRLQLEAHLCNKGDLRPKVGVLRCELADVGWYLSLRGQRDLLSRWNRLRLELLHVDDLLRGVLDVGVLHGACCDAVEEYTALRRRREGDAAAAVASRVDLDGLHGVPSRRDCGELEL